MAASVMGQDLNTKNIIVVTLDGYRWKELFEGPDDRIINNPDFITDRSAMAAFNGAHIYEKRSKLMPFFWNVIAQQGQLYGNRNYKNKVNCVNHHLLSYPGYSEMFVGYAAKGVSSNKEKDNPNATVFEFINEQHAFENKVAAFATWDIFNYIFREKQSSLPVIAGNDPPPSHAGAHKKDKKGRSDKETFAYAMDYLEHERPRVLFIGFDGTDFHGHGGRYDKYLEAAQQADKMIAELWAWVQAQPDYKDQTTLFITTDHGRGSGKKNWRNHRLLAPGSRHIWFAVMGPDTPAFGELTFKGKYYQKQVAQTIAAFLGLQYKAAKPTGEIVQTMVAAPVMADNESRSGNALEQTSNR
ncbi:MAG TPA: alkaline phosphatase family protein [Chryseosolibacter sp.]|nr:alkaline phosphatase family protein [Chryseosolibacter sp.]